MLYFQLIPETPIVVFDWFSVPFKTMSMNCYACKRLYLRLTFHNMKVVRPIQDGFDGVAQAFESTINGHSHGDSVVQSNGAVNNIDEWDFGFSLDASPVAQNGILPNSHNKNSQNDLDNVLSPSPIERDANGVGHVWDFKDAFSDAPDYKLVS